MVALSDIPHTSMVPQSVVTHAPVLKNEFIMSSSTQSIYFVYRFHELLLTWAALSPPASLVGLLDRMTLLEAFLVNLHRGSNFTRSLSTLPPSKAQQKAPARTPKAYRSQTP